MSTTDELLPYKGSIIKETFLHTADENYATAGCEEARRRILLLTLAHPMSVMTFNFPPMMIHSARAFRRTELSGRKVRVRGVVHGDRDLR